MTCRAIPVPGPQARSTPARARNWPSLQPCARYSAALLVFQVPLTKTCMTGLSASRWKVPLVSVNALVFAGKISVWKEGFRFGSLVPMKRLTPSSETHLARLEGYTVKDVRVATRTGPSSATSRRRCHFGPVMEGRPNGSRLHDQSAPCRILWWASITEWDAIVLHWPVGEGAERGPRRRGSSPRTAQHGPVHCIVFPSPGGSTRLFGVQSALSASWQGVSASCP